MSYIIAQRYAQALFDIARERSKLEIVHRDLEKIGHLLAQSSDLKDFLRDPVIPPQKFQTILKDIFHGKVDELSYKFLLFLQVKRRLPQLPSICAIFNDIYEETKNVLRTKWTSSVDLSQRDMHILTGHLKAKFNKEIVAELKVDPRIGGGIKIQIKDTIYDYTIAAQLKKFQQSVMQT